MIEILKAY